MFAFKRIENVFAFLSQAPVVLLIVASLFHILAIFIFVRCKKLSFNIRFWLIHLLVGVLLAILLRAGALTASSFDQDGYGLMFRIFEGGARSSMHSSIITTTVMGVDRLLSAVFAFRYITMASRRRTYQVAAAVNAFAVAVSVTTVFIGDVYVLRNYEIFSSSRVAMWTTIFLVTTSALATVTLYSVSGVIVIRKQRGSIRMNTDYSRLQASCAKSFIVAFVYLCCVIPVMISMSVCLLNENDVEIPVIARALPFVFLFVQPFVFILSFHESRYRFLILLCCCCKSYRQTISNNVKQHYCTFKIPTRQSLTDTYCELSEIVHN